MMQENGKGTIKLIFIICVIIIVVFGIARYVQGLIKKEKIKDMQADLLLVQSKVEITKGKYTINSNENPLQGVQFSKLIEQYNASKNEIDKNEENLETKTQTDTNELSNVNLLNEYKVSEFIEKNVISTDEYEKYYILNSDNLSAMGLQELINKYDGYFIVNYNDYEVIYTEGYENVNGMFCYKISDLNKTPQIINSLLNQTKVEVVNKVAE